MDRQDVGSARDNLVTEKIIGCAIEVHRTLGAGLLESAYEECLCYELAKIGLGFKRQLVIPVVYKELKLDCGYRIDLIVEDTVVVEIKAVERLLPVHEAQLLTYLKLLRRPLGLLINFHVPVIKVGLKRIVHPLGDSSAPSRLRGEDDRQW